MMTSKPKSKSAKKRIGRSRYSRDQLVEIFSRFRQQRKEPKGELDHVNAYTLLVAVVLSAQATDVGVNKATKGTICRCRYAGKNGGTG